MCSSDLVVGPPLAAWVLLPNAGVSGALMVVALGYGAVALLAGLAAPPEATVERKAWTLRGRTSGIVATVVLLLAVMIVLPVGWLVVYSLSDKQGGFTLGNFATLFTDPTFVDPLVTTLILATSVAVICCLVAAPMGWLVARTDMPIRRTVRDRKSTRLNSSH